MAVTQAPPATTTKLVRSPWRQPADGAAPLWRLAPCDRTSVAIATTRATFWPARFDAAALERGLALVLEDLPWLSGRLAPLKLPVGWKLGDVNIALTNEGAELTVVEAPHLTLAACGPDSWPMRGVTVSGPAVPPYLPAMDTSKKLLAGQEPLMKVRLTRLADGDVLGITLSHVVTDGMHWPALHAHVAARYRQAASGRPAPAGELLAADAGKAGMSVEALRKKLPGGLDWQPEPFVVKPNLRDCWRAASLMWHNASKKVDLEILHLPRARLAALKAAVQEAPGAGAVTSGDVVQALAALAVHAAEGSPLVPVRPKVMLALVQVPGTEPSYFGNAVHPLAVGLPEGSPQPAAGGGGGELAALRALAVQIRAATAELRASPSKALQALYESEAACASPVLKSLAFLAGRRLPFVASTTNYIGSLPSDAELDFGLGARHLGMRHLTTPLAASMAVVRRAAPPYGEGLFVQMALTAGEGARLRAHPLLRELAPDATWLGGGKGGERPPSRAGSAWRALRRSASGA